ncbi:hypothetical protein CC78DRAFT_577164 [Lojkania enalia]|uniref:Potassium transport protein n=1 Tax=Lojkania enalia TaxID=147567 RepID=A0A9P4KGV0_9PLEO|nr:hypothetical protein CC78DRAFT_577164 [Didymosphaeria enalia]
MIGISKYHYSSRSVNIPQVARFIYAKDYSTNAEIMQVSPQVDDAQPQTEHRLSPGQLSILFFIIILPCACIYPPTCPFLLLTTHVQVANHQGSVDIENRSNMWKPPINFITLHYAYILSFGILAMIIIYPYGNLKAVDAYFFGVSGSTESGLNTIDVKALKTYQQLFIYFVPIITNLGFINILVVVVRLHWFRKRFKGLDSVKRRSANRFNAIRSQATTKEHKAPDLEAGEKKRPNNSETVLSSEKTPGNAAECEVPENANESEKSSQGTQHISFALDEKHTEDKNQSFHIPSPHERENGQPIVLLLDDEDDDAIKPAPPVTGSSDARWRGKSRRSSFSNSTTLDHAVSSMFVLGATSTSQGRDELRKVPSVVNKPADLPYLFSEPTIGRNSNFYNLDEASWEELGGIEYRALKVLLKIVVGYFFGLHIIGVIGLLGWVHGTSPSKYTEYIQSQGQDRTWWAFYSAQTMVDNLGFTLTPDSMVSFQDATWPMLLMSFLAFAGNTFYPCFLRLVIWSIYKLVPQNSSLKDPLRFLLDHPRRCYTLLFPSTATWVLTGILFVLNFIDILLIIVLDLHNSAVNNLPIGPRILAAIFQAASSRHTGTSTFNLAAVNPAVQFSLLVMMYISVYPIAISIRASNTYEEKALGIYSGDETVDERHGRTYLLAHMRNQLSFDLWYIFIGIFCICVAESERIMDPAEDAFSVFAIFFEVVSAYGNVGLSLGHPSNLTSLCGHFSTFSKLVICAMMLRGRHRGLPYSLDRAITLPSDQFAEDTHIEHPSLSSSESRKMKKFHTT